MSVELALLSATELVERYRSGEVSPVQAAEAALDQIGRHDADVNAYCLVDGERVLEAARASEARWARGEPAGPVDGVPVAVKDVFLTRGWPTLRGSRLVDPDQEWDDDAPSVASLRAAGAVLVGKTTTPELGWKGVTDSPLSGITRNPWDLACTPGGSSGGSSAALVLGMATLALGTDGGGSIRIPASFCGHPGLKPTHGRVALWPASPYGTLAHAGPMARHVADLALMLDVIARPDPRDGAGLPAAGPSFRSRLDEGVEGLRIAYSSDLGGRQVDRQVADAVDAAATAFVELGAVVEAVDPHLGDPLEVYLTLWNAGAAAATRRVLEDRHHLMDPGLVRALTGVRGLSALDYLEAVRRRDELAVVMGLFHQRWDLLITPAVAVPPFPAGADVPPGWADERWPTWTPFSYPFNLTGQPAASVPCGFTAAGLPIGLQIVGPRHADALVLRAARAYEAASPPDRRPALLGSAANERT